MRIRLAGLAAAIAFLVVVTVFAAVPSAAIGAPVHTGVDGGIYTLARHGHTVYAGGSFGAFGTATGGAVAVSPTTGAPLWTHAPFGTAFSPYLSEAVDDGSGGYYVIGDSPKIRHITATGHLDPNWSWSLTGGAYRLVRSGDVLLTVGGGDPTRGTIEAIRATPHPIRLWTVTVSGSISALAATSTTVYVSGSFLGVGGASRSGLAALSSTDGSIVAAFDPRPNGPSAALAVDPSGTTLYVAGSFTAVDGVARAGEAAISTANGQVVPGWAPPAVTDVSSIAVGDDDVYVIGQFTKVGGTARRGFAALSRADGSLQPLDPQVGPFGGIEQVAVAGGLLYVTGFFQRIQGVPRPYAAAIDLPTGHVAPWNPEPRGHPNVLVATATAVFLAGDFTVMGGAMRDNLAAFDAQTGDLLPFALPVDGQIVDMAVSGSTLYLGGEFSHVGGVRRHDLASIDLTTGRVTDWDPRPNNIVLDLVVRRGTVYVAGSFTRIAGKPRQDVAAVASETGQLLPLRVSVDNGEVDALAVMGHTMYLGGSFVAVDDVARHGLAAVDVRSGRVLPFAPPPANGAVWDIAATPSAVFVAGPLTKVGTARRRSVAALRPGDGKLLHWNPIRERRALVFTLAVSGSVVYITGGFSPLATGLSPNLAAVSAKSGRPLAWPALHVPASQAGLALLPSRQSVFAGGYGWWGPVHPA